MKKPSAVRGVLYLAVRLTHDAQDVNAQPVIPSHSENLSPLIRLDQITAGYADQPVLQKFSLTLPSGEFLALVGPNGCGKTTLLKAMMGLLPVTQGTREVLGIKNPKASELSGKMVYIPQRLLLNRTIPVTVGEFLQLRMSREGDASLKGSAGDWRKAMSTSLKDVGLDASVLKKSIHLLSGGQMQRVFIAYALIGRPKLLFLDEVTEGLDVGGQDQLFALLKDKVARDHSSLVLVSHDLSQVTRYASRVICLNGNILFDGDPQSQDFHACMHTMYGERSWIHEHRH